MYIRAQGWVFWFQYISDMGGDKAFNLLILLTLKCLQHLVCLLWVPHEHQICCNAFLGRCLWILILLYHGSFHLVTRNQNIKHFSSESRSYCFHFKLKCPSASSTKLNLSGWLLHLWELLVWNKDNLNTVNLNKSWFTSDSISMSLKAWMAAFCTGREAYVWPMHFRREDFKDGNPSMYFPMTPITYTRNTLININKIYVHYISIR